MLYNFGLPRAEGRRKEGNNSPQTSLNETVKTKRPWRCWYKLNPGPRFSFNGPVSGTIFFIHTVILKPALRKIIVNSIKFAT